MAPIRNLAAQTTKIQRIQAMPTTAQGTGSRVGGIARLMTFIKNILARRRTRLHLDDLSPAARRDLMLPDPAPDPREPWY